MNRLISLSLLPVTLCAVLGLSACSSGNDQPQLEPLSKADAANKQAMGEVLRNRQRTTQIDR